MDTLEKKDYFKNLLNTEFADLINFKKGLDYISNSIRNCDIEVIFHIGATADILVENGNIMLEENFEHSKFVSVYKCLQFSLKF